MDDRRTHVPFDPGYFEDLARRGIRYSMAETFHHVYAQHFWSSPHSVSGEGARIDQTQQIRNELPALLRALRVDVLLDAPCGDFGWMQFVDLPVATYIGADIVPELVARNRAQYGSDRRCFITLDLTRDVLPRADLVLCRDCLVHFSFDDIRQALCNVKRSGAAYLLTTTFTASEENEDVVTGDWRTLNLEVPPFNFPAPQYLLNERCTEGGGRFQDKSLGLWALADLPQAFFAAD